MNYNNLLNNCDKFITFFFFLNISIVKCTAVIHIKQMFGRISLIRSEKHEHFNKI